MYDHYVREYIGYKSIAEIRYSDIRKFYLHLIRDCGFKPNSMEIIHTILHPVFNVAVRDDMIRHNPTDGVMAEIKKSHNEEENRTAQVEKRVPILLPHFSAHNLRHTFCTRFCEHETNLKIIQEIMGHADITTTMDIYNEATKKKKKESFANLEGKIKIR